MSYFAVGSWEGGISESNESLMPDVFSSSYINNNIRIFLSSIGSRDLGYLFRVL